MDRPRGLLPSLALVVAAALALGGCATYHYRPLPEVPFRQQAQSKSERGITVTVAVPTDEQIAEIFGVRLTSYGIQPVWVEIDNRTDRIYSFAADGMDSEYFTPREAANRSRLWFRPEDNRRMRARFTALAIDPYVGAGERIAGFVYTNLERGLKPLNVELIGRGELRQFFFVAEVPGIRTHFEHLDWAAIYPPDQVRDVDEAGLRAALGALPCCGATQDGRGLEDPLNFALVGDVRQVLGALARAGWHVTEVLDVASAWRTFRSYFLGSTYRAAPISPIWLFGRRQDLAMQKARATARERNHLRVWLAPLRFEGRPVWIGQISRDIGLLYRPLLDVAHEVDPDVDEARDYLVRDLLRSQSVARIGWVNGVGATPATTPRRMADGTVFFTDGLRAVMFLSSEPLGLDEIQFLDWEDPSLDDPARPIGPAPGPARIREPAPSPPSPSPPAGSSR